MEYLAARGRREPKLSVVCRSCPKVPEHFVVLTFCVLFSVYLCLYEDVAGDVGCWIIYHGLEDGRSSPESPAHCAIFLKRFSPLRAREIRRQLNVGEGGGRWQKKTLAINPHRLPQLNERAFPARPSSTSPRVIVSPPSPPILPWGL